MPQRVVDQISTQDAVTGSRTETRYLYRHGVYDGVEREFRGFAYVEQQDAEAPTGDPLPLPPTLVRRWYHTGLDLEGTVVREFGASGESRLQDDIPIAPAARRALRGHVRREEIYFLDKETSPADAHRALQVTETAYKVFPIERTPGTQRYSFAALPIRKRVISTERSAEKRIVETTTTYDLHRGRGFGLPTEVREKGYGRLGSFTTAHEQQQAVTLERSTKTTYVTLDVLDTDFLATPYVPTYIVGKPSVVERWGGTVGSETLLTKTRNFYDGTAYQGLGYPGSGTSLGVTKGLLSCTLEQAFTSSQFSAAYPGGADAQTARDARGNFLQDTDYYVHSVRTQYSTTGMPTGSKDANGNVTTFTYDSTYGLFPISVTDPLSNPTTLTRGELPFQVAVVVDANDNRTEFTFDPTGLPATKSVMGKFVSSAWQGDPITHPTEVYTYDFSTLPIRTLVQTRQVREGATFDVHRYVDGLGRTVQERHTAEPDPATPTTPRFRVTGWQIYNHKGLVVRAYQPTFSGSSAYAPGSTLVPSLETLYDPLGRPVRVNHPDGTYQTTDYHPWVTTTRDRNDNAAAITSADPRYGAHVHTFRGHIETPTRKYVDALGREIAVSENNGTGASSVFRVTTYSILAGEFTGTTYDLVLNQNLAANHFVLIKGAVDSATATPANTGVRVTQDPAGTGDLAASSGANVIRLERSSNSQGDWVGAVTVWECVTDIANAGFRLVDVKTVSFAAASSGTEQTTTVTSASWTVLSRVALYGAWGGAGGTCGSTSGGHQPLFAGFAPSGTSTIDAARWRIGGTLAAADFTVYVVEWGSEHSIQRVEVTGSTGGDALDAASEFATASISAVRSASSWVFASGWTKPASGADDSFAAQAVTLGTGPAPVPDVADKVAVGGETAVDRKCWVTVHTHPSLVVHHVNKADGDSSATSKDIEVTIGGETESYDETGTLRSTAGLRVPVFTNSLGAAGTQIRRTTWAARITSATNLEVVRLNAGDAWVGFAQAVDTVGVVAPETDSADLHVTRSVLNLKDEVTEVWDPRGLASATWTFEYDLRGQRTKAANSTGVGSRWSLADAQGNPIWSRDARGIEVARTFDAGNRPLQEESDDGTTVKLRRKWTYVPYNASDNTSKNANLFGRVEEERDQDGLRYFEYDWRGLVTKVSHKFWDADWTNSSWSLYGNNDEAAIPSVARSSLSTWLTLTSLTDTTTVAATTTYDAAGRPAEEIWPEGMKLRRSYNEAGMPKKHEYDRGAGSGYEVGIQDTTYNARGQLTGYSHGNGVICTREYDTDTERLTRIFAKKTSGGEVRLQDLAYAYDPVGNPVQITDQLATSSFTSNQIIPNTRTFRYDPRYRLIRATGKRHKQATDGVDTPVTASPSANDYYPYTHRYSYDAVGNFTTNQEYKSGTNNLDYKTGGLIDLFDGFGSESYTYDTNGCCTATPRHSTIGYQFDAQPVFVDMSGGGRIRYRRHGDQRAIRCITKSTVSGLRIYLGPWEYEHRKTGGTTDFVKTVLHVEGKSRYAQAERLLTGTDSTSLSVFHIHADHLGSAQALTKSDATLLCQEEFFPYGRASDRRDARNRYRFIGVERDEHTGLCMTGPRTFDPVTGRFLQGDPIAATRGGWSPFCYGRASPVGRVDPGGYQDQPAPEAQAPILPYDPVGGPADDVMSAGVDLARQSPTVQQLEKIAAQSGPVVISKYNTTNPQTDMDTGEIELTYPSPESPRSTADIALDYSYELTHRTNLDEMRSLNAAAEAGEVSRQGYTDAIVDLERRAWESRARTASDLQIEPLDVERSADQAFFMRQVDKLERLQSRLASSEPGRVARIERKIGRVHGREERFLRSQTGYSESRHEFVPMGTLYGEQYDRIRGTSGRP